MKNVLRETDLFMVSEVVEEGKDPVIVVQSLVTGVVPNSFTIQQKTWEVLGGEPDSTLNSIFAICLVSIAFIGT